MQGTVHIYDACVEHESARQLESQTTSTKKILIMNYIRLFCIVAQR